jgi:hypothetical protein
MQFLFFRADSLDEDFPEPRRYQEFLMHSQPQGKKPNIAVRYHFFTYPGYFSPHGPPFARTLSLYPCHRRRGISSAGTLYKRPGAAFDHGCHCSLILTSRECCTWYPDVNDSQISTSIW